VAGAPPATIVIARTRPGWHAPADADATLSAARRLLARIPHARLRLFDSDEGHLAGFHREADILDELLARG
jgi:hypothetical protein